MRHRIDLHGLTHDQVVAKLEAELIGISLGKNWDVEIITGKSKQIGYLYFSATLKIN